MEFSFNVNDVFKSPIVEITHNLIPPGYTGDRRQLWDTVSKVSEIVNEMGAASAAAQGLSKPITTADRIRNSEHKLYFLVDQKANKGKGAVTGMLKTGNKSLYVFDREGNHYQVQPPCLLDFYIHESKQRNGLGKTLFEHMLEKEGIVPVQMAIDRPSEKLLGFLNKHYQLKDPVKQMNNYVVFDDFFPRRSFTAQETPTHPEGNIRSKNLHNPNSANGLQQFSSPMGRYGAPRPPCSMGQIIHNQSPNEQRQEPTGVQSIPATNYQEYQQAYSSNNAMYAAQNTPNMYYNQYQPQLTHYQNVMSQSYQDPCTTQAYSMGNQMVSDSTPNYTQQTSNYQAPPQNTYQNQNTAELKYPMENKTTYLDSYKVPGPMPTDNVVYTQQSQDPNVTNDMTSQQSTPTPAQQETPQDTNAQQQYQQTLQYQQQAAALNQDQNAIAQQNANIAAQQQATNLAAQQQAATIAAQQQAAALAAQQQAVQQQAANLAAQQQALNAAAQQQAINAAAQQQAISAAAQQAMNAAAQQQAINAAAQQQAINAAAQQTANSAVQQVQGINNQQADLAAKEQAAYYAAQQQVANIAAQQQAANIAAQQAANIAAQLQNVNVAAQQQAANMAYKYTPTLEPLVPQQPRSQFTTSVMPGYQPLQAIQSAPLPPVTHYAATTHSAPNFVPQIPSGMAIPNYNQGVQSFNMAAGGDQGRKIMPGGVMTPTYITPIASKQEIPMNAQYVPPSIPNYNAPQNVDMGNKQFAYGQSGDYVQQNKIENEQSQKNYSRPHTAEVCGADRFKAKDTIRRKCDGTDFVKKSTENDLKYGYPPQVSHDVQKTPEQPNQSKLERPRSLVIQQEEPKEVKEVVDEKEVDDADKDSLADSIDIGVEELDIEEPVTEKVKIRGTTEKFLCAENKTPSPRKTPSHLTEQGYFDLKFYHNKLW